MTKWLLPITALLCASLAPAQTAQPILQPHQYFLDGSGNPCAGCSLYSYVAGTSTPQATYTTASETVPNANPVILDAAGGASIWLGSSPYKFVLVDTFGTTLWTVDQVQTPTAGGTAYLPLAGGTLTGPLTAPYFQFSSPTLNACSSGQYVIGWNTSGWVCATPTPGGSAGGDLSGSYPNPTVKGINGGTVPTSATVLGTDSSGKPINQTGTIANNTTGNAATATALAAAPTQCAGGNFATGIAANGNANCSTPGSGAIIQVTHLGAASCSPPGSSYATCTNVLTWPAAFATAGYYAVCSGVGPIGGGGGSNSLIFYPDGPTSSSPPTTTTITVVVQNNSSDSGTAAADIYCIGIHP